MLRLHAAPASGGTLLDLHGEWKRPASPAGRALVGVDAPAPDRAGDLSRRGCSAGTLSKRAGHRERPPQPLRWPAGGTADASPPHPPPPLYAKGAIAEDSGGAGGSGGGGKGRSKRLASRCLRAFTGESDVTPKRPSRKSSVKAPEVKLPLKPRLAGDLGEALLDRWPPLAADNAACAGMSKRNASSCLRTLDGDFEGAPWTTSPSALMAMISCPALLAILVAATSAAPPDPPMLALSSGDREDAEGAGEEHGPGSCGALGRHRLLDGRGTSNTKRTALSPQLPNGLLGASGEVCCTFCCGCFRIGEGTSSCGTRCRAMRV